MALDPTLASTEHNLGIALLEQKKTDEGIASSNTPSDFGLIISRQSSILGQRF